MTRSRWCPFVALIAALGLAAGCGGGPRPPELTDAQVTVTLNGAALPNAQVTFYPADRALGPDAASTGVTDEKGVARLACGAKPGACVGLNRVTVTEGPMPAELRDESPEAQVKAQQFLKGLKNRPIPARYENVLEGKLEQTVEKGKAEYRIALTR